MMQIPHVQSLKKKNSTYTCFILVIQHFIDKNKLFKRKYYYFFYSNCILHPYGSSNYNTKACKHIKEKQHKHNKYVNVGEIFDQREPYHLKSSNCFMKVQTTDKRSEVGLSM